ncbi:MAG: hypothetical protein IJZ93_06935 [Clostridia bacterium]|nr:hypothetical protein [Clostridia bacterium]
MSNKVAIFMLFGQSNATGHAMPMDEKDIIKEPLKNVWGLNREPNQSFDTEKLKFSGYTSFGMNLAETQDNTYSVANCLARLWQDEIDSGNKAQLPDLYVIHISIGAQGLYGMWHPDRARKLIPGKLGDVDISLYPFTVHILKLLKKHLEDCSLEPEFVGLHWRGGEEERNYGLDIVNLDLKNMYKRFFAGLREAIGYEVPITLHRMPYVDAMMKEDPTGGHLKAMEYMNDIFEQLANEQTKTTTFEPLNAPHYDPNAWDKNLFRWDLIHYTGKTNAWVAEEIFKEFKEKKKIIKKKHLGLHKMI